MVPVPGLRNSVNFVTKLEICHETSSPYYHESNGRTERAVQTIKNMIKKCDTEEELTLAIIA